MSLKQQGALESAEKVFVVAFGDLQLSHSRFSPTKRQQVQQALEGSEKSVLLKGTASAVPQVPLCQWGFSP